MKKLLSLFFALVLCFSCSVTSFAENADSTIQPNEKSVTTLSIDQEVQINNSEFVEYRNYGNLLAETLRSTTPENYEAVMESFCSSNTNPVFEDVLDVISENNKKK